MSDALERVIYHGRTMDKMTRAFVQAAEEKLGYELTIIQGSYNNSVGASAGTHDGGGVLDLVAWDADRKLRVIKDLGGFGWYRPAIRGLWGAHLHVGIIGHPKLAPAAARQVTSYLNGRNGLKGDDPDRSYRADPPARFRYPVKEKPMVPPANNVTKARDQLTVALDALGNAAALLDQTPEERAVAQNGGDRAQALAERVTKLLELLPAR